MLTRAARIRRDWNYHTPPSRAACWICGLREQASIHGTETWWQHEYVAAILTKVR